MLQDSSTPTLQDPNTPALQESSTPTLQDSNTPSLQDYTTAMESFTQSTQSGEIRDAFPLSQRFYSGLLSLLQASWRRSFSSSSCLAHPDSLPFLLPVYSLFLSLITLPEFSPALTCSAGEIEAGTFSSAPILPASFLTDLFTRLQLSNLPREHPTLRTLLHWMYRDLPPVRREIRHHIHAFLAGYTRGPKESAGVRTCLEVLSCIIRGLHPPCLPAHAALLHSTLLPLHMPSGMLSMRYSEPLIAQYHQVLVYCVLGLVSLDPSLGPEVVRGIARAWPTAWESNSMKEILLLGEVEQVLEQVIEKSVAEAARTLTAGIPLLVQTLGSPNGRVAERAFKIITGGVLARCLVRPPAVSGVEPEGSLEGEQAKTIQSLLPVILQDGTKHWNQTVNSQRGKALRALYKINQAAFTSHAEFMWGPNAEMETIAKRALTQFTGSTSACAGSAEAMEIDSQECEKNSTVENSIDSTLGRLGVTPFPPSRPNIKAKVGFAPTGGTTGMSLDRPEFAAGGGGLFEGRGIMPPRMSPSMLPGGVMPPKMITGGMIGGRGLGGVASSQKGWVPCAAPFARQVAAPVVEVRDEVAVEEAQPTKIIIPSSGVERMLAYSLILAPKDEDQDTAASPSEAALSSLTPTLLRDLSFQELVFGNDLGSGAFATVRYARHIKKGEPQSRWPEYAVKVISTSKIKEMGYEASVRREIAVLQRMSHPGIARLITSFRWRDGAYLVLEFASKGDLFSQLTSGGLPESLVKFWAGEVLAALGSVHAAGFSYGDLKPENILLTGSGHAKLGDFGAVRPLTTEAKEFCDASRRIITQLRDGDWRVKAGIALASEGGQEVEEGERTETSNDPVDEDERMEGTALYLAPELLAGGASSVAGDLWAFGCVLYQSLTGRPPLSPLSSTSLQADPANHTVHFDPQLASGLDVREPLSFPTEVSKAAQDLILGLLHPDPTQRTGCRTVRGLDEIKDHPFFEGLDVATLYQSIPPPAALKVSAPPPDVIAAADGRRQSSVMWTPNTMKAYTFVGRAYSMEPLTQMDDDWTSSNLGEKNMIPLIPVLKEELETLQE